MSEHHTRNTLEVTNWSRPSGRFTQHRVDAGHQGPCLEHHPKTNARGESKKQETARRKREAQAQQPALFGDRP